MLFNGEEVLITDEFHVTLSDSPLLSQLLNTLFAFHLHPDYTAHYLRQL